VLFCTAVALQCAWGAPSSVGEDQYGDLGASAGVQAAMMETYKRSFVTALTQGGKSAGQARAMYDQRGQLGESLGAEARYVPKPGDSAHTIKRKAMNTAVKILKLEQEKAKLVAENTLNAESIPDFDVAKALMNDKQYASFHRASTTVARSEKNNKYLEKERVRMTALMERTLNGKHKKDMEVQMNSMVSSMERKYAGAAAAAGGAAANHVAKLKDKVANSAQILKKYRYVNQLHADAVSSKGEVVSSKASTENSKGEKDDSKGESTQETSKEASDPAALSKEDTKGESTQETSKEASDPAALSKEDTKGEPAEETSKENEGSNGPTP